MPAYTLSYLPFWNERKSRKRFYTAGEYRLDETISGYFYETGDPNSTTNKQML